MPPPNDVQIAPTFSERLRDPSGAKELGYIGSLLCRAFYSYVGLVGKILEEHELTEHIRFGMGNALFALYDQDDRTISELGHQLCVSKSSMTGTVATLRSAGLVELNPDPHDGRVSRLVLTPLARSLEGDLKRAVRHINRIVGRRFDKQERESLKDMLSALLDEIGELITD